MILFKHISEKQCELSYHFINISWLKIENQSTFYGIKKMFTSMTLCSNNNEFNTWLDGPWQASANFHSTTNSGTTPNPQSTPLLWSRPHRRRWLNLTQRYCISVAQSSLWELPPVWNPLSRSPVLFNNELTGTVRPSWLWH